MLRGPRQGHYAPLSSFQSLGVAQFVRTIFATERKKRKGCALRARTDRRRAHPRQGRGSGEAMRQGRPRTRRRHRRSPSSAPRARAEAEAHSPRPLLQECCPSARGRGALRSGRPPPRRPQTRKDRGSCAHLRQSTRMGMKRRWWRKDDRAAAGATGSRWGPRRTKRALMGERVRRQEHCTTRSEQDGMVGQPKSREAGMGEAPGRRKQNFVREMRSRNAKGHEMRRCATRLSQRPRMEEAARRCIGCRRASLHSRR